MTNRSNNIKEKLEHNNIKYNSKSSNDYNSQIKEDQNLQKKKIKKKKYSN